MGTNGPMAFFPLGFTIGGFVLAFNLYSYILHGFRFPFIATLSKPFLKFSFNNFILPAVFLLVYCIFSYRFQRSEALLKPGRRSSIWPRCSAGYSRSRRLRSPTLPSPTVRPELCRTPPPGTARAQSGQCHAPPPGALVPDERKSRAWRWRPHVFPQIKLARKESTTTRRCWSACSPKTTSMPVCSRLG